MVESGIIAEVEEGRPWRGGRRGGGGEINILKPERVSQGADGARQRSTLLDPAQSSAHSGRVVLLSPCKDAQQPFSVLVRAHSQVQQTLHRVPGRCRDRRTDSGALPLALRRCRRRGPARFRARRPASPRVRVHLAPRTGPRGNSGLSSTQEAPGYPLRRTFAFSLAYHSLSLLSLSSLPSPTTRTRLESRQTVSITCLKCPQSLMHRVTFLFRLQSDPVVRPLDLPQTCLRPGPAVFCLSNLLLQRTSSTAERGRWPSPFAVYVSKVRVISSLVFQMRSAPSV